MTRLRPAGEHDLELLAGWFADPSFVEHWGATPLTRDEVAAKYVGRRRPEVESFVILASEEPIGYAQFWQAGHAPASHVPADSAPPFEPDSGVPADSTSTPRLGGPVEGGLDVVLVVEARGRGHGPWVADALATHLFQVRGWSRVTVDPVASNVRAVRAWEKAGFAPVGRDGDLLIMERRRPAARSRDRPVTGSPPRS